MEMSRREQIDARVEALRVRFRMGDISETAFDRELASLEAERAALISGLASGARPDGADRWERLESAIDAFCHTYLWYQPRGE
jgi:hypothetical protein